MKGVLNRQLPHERLINMIIGYARVSTKDQNLDMQIEAINEYAKKTGVPASDVVIYKEKESGAKVHRVELENALKALRTGDKFVVYKIDRLARSTKQLLDSVDIVREKGAEFVSIANEGMDTTSSNGRLLFTIMAGVAEFERELISERTKAGLESARKQGRTGGRPNVDESTRKQVITLKQAGHRAVDIAKEYGIARSTVYKILKESDTHE